VAVYRQLRGRPAGPSRARQSRRLGLRLIAIAGALTVASATGAAAAGGLPGPVQDTTAALLATVGINVPNGAGVPAGPSVPPPAITTTTTAPVETSTAVTVADTTMEAEASAPISTEATVAASEAPAPGAAPGPRDAVDDARPGTDRPAEAEGAAPAKDDSPKAAPAARP
jgi:hypothetical protein